MQFRWWSMQKSSVYTHGLAEFIVYIFIFIRDVKFANETRNLLLYSLVESINFLPGLREYSLPNRYCIINILSGNDRIHYGEWVFRSKYSIHTALIKIVNVILETVEDEKPWLFLC